MQLRGDRLIRPPFPDPVFSDKWREFFASNLETTSFLEWPEAGSGLRLQAANCEIRGLVINEFPLCGILVEGNGSTIQGNYLGLDTSGSDSRPSGHGTSIPNDFPPVTSATEKLHSMRGAQIALRSSYNLVGGLSLNEGNVISGMTSGGSGFMPPGVLISGPGAGFNSIQGNIIGLDKDGKDRPGGAFTGPFPPTAYLGQCAGVFISDASDNEIGGLTPGARNIISGNFCGVWMDGPHARNNRALGNLIGTDISRVPLHFASQSIQLNYIEARDGETGPDGNLMIRRNFYETETYSHRWYGILMTQLAAENQIGGLEPGAGNTIAGVTDAIMVEPFSTVFLQKLGPGYTPALVPELVSPSLGGPAYATGIRILGNQIGSPPEYPDELSVVYGVNLNGTSDSIVQGNFFTRTIGPAIFLDGGRNHRVEHNTVKQGFASDIIAACDDTLIRGNTLLNTGDSSSQESPAIQVQSEGKRVRITENSIQGNNRLGISLSPMTKFPTPNDGDGGDFDDGANTLLDFPVLHKAVLTNGVLLVDGTLTTAIGRRIYHVEFFANSKCGLLGYGEGERFIGAIDTESDLSGRANLNFSLASPGVIPGSYITATATDPDGNTSEFSLGILVHDARDVDADQIGDSIEGNVPNRNSVNLKMAAMSPDIHVLASDAATGDGNGDGLSDAQQANVASVPGTSGKWFTLAAASGFSFKNVDPAGPGDFNQLPTDYTFPLGFVKFTVRGLTPGGSVAITNFFHNEIACDTVFAFGATAGNALPHWHDFLFDGTTGAKFGNGEVVLTFLDGFRGDGDGTANGEVTTLLALARRIPRGPQLQVKSSFVSQQDALFFSENHLGIQTVTTNRVQAATTVLAWKSTTTDQVLQFTDELSLTNGWRTIYTAPVVVNGQNVITNVGLDITRFFRLVELPPMLAPVP